MPIAITPDVVVRVTFRAEQDLPEDKRPALECRVLTCRQHLRYQQLLADAVRASNAGEHEREVGLLVEAFKTAGVVARNFPGNFADVAPEALPDVLTVTEIWEAAYSVMREAGEVEEKKRAKPASPSGSGAAPSAGSAPAPAAA